MSKCITLDIEIHDPESCPDGAGFVQAKYLVHGHDDVLWTDSMDDALAYLRQCLEELRKP